MLQKIQQPKKMKDKNNLLLHIVILKIIDKTIP